MRTAVVTDKRTIAVKEVPDPVPQKDEVVIKIHHCGICGSDLHVFEEGVDIGIGHEFSGDIVEVGSEVTGWCPGDRITVEPRWGCGRCFWCQRGETGLCEEFYISLTGYQGAFATFTKAKARQVHQIPDELSYEQAAIIEPTACALHAVRLSGIQAEDVVAVLGLGPIGQLAARLAREMGAAAVYGTDKSPSRLALAEDVLDEGINITNINLEERIKELTQGRGADIVLECAGAVSSTRDSLAVVRKGGTVIVAGICFDWVEMPVSSIVLRGLTLKGSICFNVGEFAHAMEVVKKQEIDVNPLLKNQYPLDDINKAFKNASAGEGGKILVSP